MSPEILNNFGVVILGAGKGTRLKCVEKPKVMLDLAGRPIVSYVVETLKKIGFDKNQICLVVGFKKETVKDYFKDEVIYAEQKEQLGTAHATHTGSRALPSGLKNILVINGDDSAFYRPETLLDFLKKHTESQAVVSILTVTLDHAQSSGKIVRSESGEISIVEKENLTEEQKEIKEVSTGTMCLDKKWFENVFPNMKPMRGLNEYGLPDVLVEAKKIGETAQFIKLKNNQEWLGINTPEELAEANKRKSLK